MPVYISKKMEIKCSLGQNIFYTTKMKLTQNNLIKRTQRTSCYSMHWLMLLPSKLRPKRRPRFHFEPPKNLAGAQACNPSYSGTETEGS